MCAVQLLRVSVHERISAAAEDFLLQVEKEEEAAEIPALRALLTERLTAAAEEIVGLFEETVAEYEDRVERSEREICRQRRLLDAVLKPEVRLHRADVQQQVPPQQQDWNPSLVQEQPEPPHVKEEQEEVWSSQEGEQLEALEEADINKFPFSPVPVKTEDDEEKPQSSQLHQSQTEDNRDSDRGSEPGWYLHPVSDSFDSTETEVSNDDWRDERKLQSGLNPQRNSKVPVGGEKPFSCSECEKTFNHGYLLKRHMRTHTGEKPFACSFCGKRFSQKGNMIYHMGRHTGEKRFSCSICDRRFTWLSGVKRHKCADGTVVSVGEAHADGEDCGGSEPARNLDPDRSRLEPDTNDKASDSSEDTDDVWQETRDPDPGQSVTTMKKLLNCFRCGEIFSCRRTLLTHMRNHGAENPFSCSVCEKQFSWSHSLRKHMKIHSEEKPFSCSLCGKTFIQKRNLQVHIRTHTGEKPFSCSICQKGFTQRAHLLDHMRCHTGEKPFSCSVCEKRFRFRGGIGRHMKIHKREAAAFASRDFLTLNVRVNEAAVTERRNEN